MSSYRYDAHSVKAGIFKSNVRWEQKPFTQEEKPSELSFISHC